MKDLQKEADPGKPEMPEKKAAPLPFNTILFAVSFLVCLALAWFFFDFGLKQTETSGRRSGEGSAGSIPATPRSGAAATTAPGAPVDADFVETDSHAPPAGTQDQRDPRQLMAYQPGREADLPVAGPSGAAAHVPAPLPPAPTPAGQTPDHTLLPKLASERETPAPVDLSPRELLELTEKHGSEYLLQGRHLVATPPPGIYRPSPTPPMPDIAVPEALKKRTGKATPRVGPTPRTYKPIMTNIDQGQLRPPVAVPGANSQVGFPSDAGSVPAREELFEDPVQRSARRLQEHLDAMGTGGPPASVPAQATPAADVPMPTPYGTTSGRAVPAGTSAAPSYAAGLEQAISAGGVGSIESNVPSLTGAPVDVPPSAVTRPQGKLAVSAPDGPATDAPGEVIPPPDAGAGAAATPAPERQELVIKKNGAEVVISNLPPGTVRDGAAAAGSATAPAVEPQAAAGSSGAAAPGSVLSAEEAERRLAAAGSAASLGAAGKDPAAVTPVPAPSGPGSPPSSVVSKEEAERRIEEATRDNPTLKPRESGLEIDPSKLPPELAGKVDDSPSQLGASVGDKKLTPQDLKRRVELVKLLDPDGAIAHNPEQAEQWIAEIWAERTALAGEARTRGITVSPAEIEEQRKKLQQINGPNFDSALRQARFTEAEVTAEVEDTALVEKLVDTIFQDKFNEQRLRQVYEQAPDQFPASRRIRVAEIVKAKPSDAGGQRQAADEMKQIQAQAAGGGDFGELAKAHSEAATRRAGGDMGWLDAASRIDPKMGQAISNLQPGQVSQVVDTGDSLAVYQLIEVEEPKPGFDGARRLVEAQVKGLIRRELFDSIQAKTTVRVGGDVMKGGLPAQQPRQAAKTARMTYTSKLDAAGAVPGAGAAVSGSDFGKPIPQPTGRANRR